MFMSYPDLWYSIQDRATYLPMEHFPETLRNASNGLPLEVWFFSFSTIKCIF